MMHYLRASFLALIACTLTGSAVLFCVALQAPSAVTWQTGKVNVEVILPLSKLNFAGQFSALKATLIDHLTKADAYDSQSQLTLLISPLFRDNRLEYVRATLGPLHKPIAQAKFDAGGENLTSLITGLVQKGVPGPVELRRGKRDYIATPTFWHPQAGIRYKNEKAETFALQPYRHQMIVDGDLSPCGKGHHCVVYPAEPIKWDRPAPFQRLAGIILNAFTQPHSDARQTSTLETTEQFTTASARYLVGIPILRELR